MLSPDLTDEHVIIFYEEKLNVQTDQHAVDDFIVWGNHLFSWCLFFPMSSSDTQNKVKFSKQNVDN